MINSFFENLIQVKALACVVLILLFLVDYMSCVNIGQLAKSHDQCQKCKEENRELATLIGDWRRTNNRFTCVFVREYLRCAEPLETKCRLDIHFQAGLGLMRSFRDKNNCASTNITLTEAIRIMSNVTQSQHTEPKKQCHRPNFKPVYKVCGLFGDPHLRTFSDKRNTCSVPGAWPLFANRYLTVQVTNIPLENSSRATATSKVTVIVRGLKRKCIEEKTYQARSNSLPSVFSDGTKSSGDKDCPTTVTAKQRKKGRKIQKIQIDICALKTRIIIRQVGKYLTVHMRVPKDLTRRHTIGLCQRGCPRIEQINLDKMSRIDKVIASFYKEDKLSNRVRRQRQERAKRLCGAAKVTGFYYKSCLFDMLTSNDASFVKAARKAMKDFRTINKDDKGRPIVNETRRDSFSGPTKVQTTLSRTTDVGTTLVLNSSAFIGHKSSFSLVLFMLVVLLQVFR